MKIFNKKVAILNILVALCYSINFGQSPDHNYVVKTELLVPIINPDSIGDLGDGQKIDLIEYYDGLGRLNQTSSFHGSASGQDIVQHIEYDEAGRQKFGYLPFPAEAGGEFLTHADSLTTEYYESPVDITIPMTEFPFGERNYDNSPLNRVLKQGFPGKSWQLDDHPQRFNFLTNQSYDQVLLFHYDDETSQFNSNGYYDQYSLLVYHAYDEDGNMIRTFTDKAGNVVLQESDLAGTRIRTYYLYDVRNNLAVVIQPEGSRLISGSFSSTPLFIRRWCFTYRYDAMNRLVEKHIPGMMKPIYTVYDSLDRIILTQDGNLKQSVS